MKVLTARVVFFFAVFIAIPKSSISQQTKVENKKILIVSTNVSKINGRDNGTFLMEIAYPLAVFRKHGIKADVVTPDGGVAAIYDGGILNDTLIQIRASNFFKEAVTNSLPPQNIMPAEYSGIYYPGGGGQFYDVVGNGEIAEIARNIYEKGGVIGSAGHGAVSLLNIKLSDGGYFVGGKKLTCFPKKISAKWLPLDWEQLLKERGATVLLPTTTVEKEFGLQLSNPVERFVSGSYAENASWVAEQMVLMIKNQKSRTK